MAARAVEHCINCGAFVTDGGICHRCGGDGTLRFRGTAQAKQLSQMTADEYAQAFGEDPFGYLEPMFGRYARNITGKDRNVIFTDAVPTAGTDLKARILLNPRASGVDASLADHVSCSLGMLEHELLHEQFTDPTYLNRLREVTNADDNSRYERRTSIAIMANILEDARVERIAQTRQPQVWERIRLLHGDRGMLPKDGRFFEYVGKGDPQYDDLFNQVEVGLITDVQPGYGMTPAKWQALDPQTRAALTRILPIAQEAVMGSSLGVIDAAVAITDILDRDGILGSLGGDTLVIESPATPRISPDADGSVTPDAGKLKRKPLEKPNGPDQSRCPHCGKFMGRDGTCHHCGGDPNRQPASSALSPTDPSTSPASAPPQSPAASQGQGSTPLEAETADGTLKGGQETSPTHSNSPPEEVWRSVMRASALLVALDEVSRGANIDPEARDACHRILSDDLLVSRMYRSTKMDQEPTFGQAYRHGEQMRIEWDAVSRRASVRENMDTVLAVLEGPLRKVAGAGPDALRQALPRLLDVEQIRPVLDRLTEAVRLHHCPRCGAFLTIYGRCHKCGHPFGPDRSLGIRERAIVADFLRRIDSADSYCKALTAETTSERVAALAQFHDDLLDQPRLSRAVDRLDLLDDQGVLATLDSLFNQAVAAHFDKDPDQAAKFAAATVLAEMLANEIQAKAAAEGPTDRLETIRENTRKLVEVAERASGATVMTRTAREALETLLIKDDDACERIGKQLGSLIDQAVEAIPNALSPEAFSGTYADIDAKGTLRQLTSGAFSDFEMVSKDPDLQSWVRSLEAEAGADQRDLVTTVDTALRRCAKEGSQALADEGPDLPHEPQQETAENNTSQQSSVESSGAQPGQDWPTSGAEATERGASAERQDGLPAAGGSSEQAETEGEEAPSASEPGLGTEGGSVQEGGAEGSQAGSQSGAADAEQRPAADQAGSPADEAQSASAAESTGPGAGESADDRQQGHGGSQTGGAAADANGGVRTQNAEPAGPQPSSTSDEAGDGSDGQGASVHPTARPSSNRSPDADPSASEGDSGPSANSDRMQESVQPRFLNSDVAENLDPRRSRSGRRQSSGVGAMVERSLRRGVSEAVRRQGSRLQRRLEADQVVPVSSTVDLPDGRSVVVNSAVKRAGGIPVRLTKSDEADAIAAGLSLGRRLTRLRTDAEREKHHQRRGTLDRRRFGAALKGNERVYKKPGTRRGLDIAVSTVADVSGSMRRHMGQLHKALLATAVGLGEAELESEVVTFTDRPDAPIYQLKAFEENALNRKALADAIGRVHDRVGHGTPTTKAVAASAASLSARDETHRMMFVFTDGSPDSSIATGEAIRSARAKGIEVVGICFGDNLNTAKLLGQRLFGDDHVVVTNLSRDFPKVVERTLGRIIKRAERGGAGA